MTENTETAILAGGCFWGVQELLRQRDGVISTRVGYTGGENDNPTYGNHPGHAEAVEIVFDPERISYRDILELFFQIHDPTTKNRQGNDSTRTTSSATRRATTATSRGPAGSCRTAKPPPNQDSPEIAPGSAGATSRRTAQACAPGSAPRRRSPSAMAATP
jgi:hypothetical protein